MAPPARLPYKGLSRRLVLCFDLGTTFSGVSYSILDPGVIPVIKGVIKFPCQEQVGSDSKIPTIIYYDAAGKVCAAGAEAVKEGLQTEGWTKAEWFKLHLKPSSASARASNAMFPLPKNKSAVNIFADFMKYLYDCTRAYIRDTYANGANLWDTVERNGAFDLILTHPNGWEGAEQSQMRSAAISAGIVPDTPAGRCRVHFVTEGEASLHYCIQAGLKVTDVEKGAGVFIVDAGGGTIDISAYRRSVTGKQDEFEEIIAPQCFNRGSIFVTLAARTFITNLLEHTDFEEEIPDIVDKFDKTTKLRFRNRNDLQFVKFGGKRQNDPDLGIRAGHLLLQGPAVADFFSLSVECIVDAVKKRLGTSPKISCVFLVGGFGSSDWLYSQIKEALASHGVQVYRTLCPTNKAVADGGVSYFIDHFVTSRVARYAYGVDMRVVFDPYNREHTKRSFRTSYDEAGQKCVSGIFDVILSKDTQVWETKEFRRSYHWQYKDASSVSTTHLQIYCYKGSLKQLGWIDEDPANCVVLCRVAVDGATIRNALVGQYVASRYIYTFNFDVILLFGCTEFTAQICWKQNGVERRSAAEIVYDP